VGITTKNLGVICYNGGGETQNLPVAVAIGDYVAVVVSGRPGCVFGTPTSPQVGGGFSIVSGCSFTDAKGNIYRAWTGIADAAAGAGVGSITGVETSGSTPEAYWYTDTGSGQAATIPRGGNAASGSGYSFTGAAVSVQTGDFVRAICATQYGNPLGVGGAYTLNGEPLGTPNYYLGEYQIAASTGSLGANFTWGGEDGGGLLLAIAVGGGPVITLTPSSRTFNATAGGGNPATQTIAVSNTGGGSFAGPTLGSPTYLQGTGWLTTATYSAGVVTLGVTTGSLPAGTYNATIPLSDANATNSPQTISVQFVVAAGGGGAKGAYYASINGMG
jgi:hypothetical protein